MFSDFSDKYSVVDEMELNQCTCAGILQLILTTCVAYGSDVTDSGIQQFFFVMLTYLSVDNVLHFQIILNNYNFLILFFIEVLEDLPMMFL